MTRLDTAPFSRKEEGGGNGQESLVSAPGKVNYCFRTDLRNHSKIKLWILKLNFFFFIPVTQLSRSQPYNLTQALLFKCFTLFIFPSVVLTLQIKAFSPPASLVVTQAVWSCQLCIPLKLAASFFFFFFLQLGMLFPAKQNQGLWWQRNSINQDHDLQD